MVEPIDRTQRDVFVPFNQQRRNIRRNEEPPQQEQNQNNVREPQPREINNSEQRNRDNNIREQREPPVPEDRNGIPQGGRVDLFA